MEKQITEKRIIYVFIVVNASKIDRKRRRQRMMCEREREREILMGKEDTRDIRDKTRINHK